MGRPVGATNKNRRALEARLAEKFPEWNPIIQMAEIANNPETEIPIQLQACREVAQYLYPKLRAVEIDLEGQIDARIGWDNTHTVSAPTASGDTAQPAPKV